MPWATVAQSVWLPFRLHGIAFKTAEPQITDLLALVRLGHFAASCPRELSGGMKMPASIARTMVTKPWLIPMDEAFAAPD